MARDVAFCVDQFNVAELPGVMLEGEAEIVICGAWGGGGGGAWLPTPPQPEITDVKAETMLATRNNAHCFFIRSPRQLR
jgi:hypothetical protein